MRVERLSELDLARDSALWHAWFLPSWLLSASLRLIGYSRLIVTLKSLAIVRAEGVLVRQRCVMVDL